MNVFEIYDSKWSRALVFTSFNHQIQSKTASSISVRVCHFFSYWQKVFLKCVSYKNFFISLTFFVLLTNTSLETGNYSLTVYSWHQTSYILNSKALLNVKGLIIMDCLFLINADIVLKCINLNTRIPHV